MITVFIIIFAVIILIIAGLAITIMALYNKNEDKRIECIRLKNEVDRLREKLELRDKNLNELKEFYEKQKKLEDDELILKKKAKGVKDEKGKKEIIEKIVNTNNSKLDDKLPNKSKNRNIKK